MRRRTFLSAFVAASFFPQASWAFEPIGRCGGAACTWATPEVTYALHRVDSDDLGPDTELEVTRAMNAWAQPDCTSLAPRYQGRTDTRPGSVDGEHVIGWVESGWRRGSGTIGTTSSRLSGGIAHADIQLNGQDFRWVKGAGDPRNRTVNTFSIIAHEGGHFYGLGHSREDGALMEASYRGGILRVSADDRAGICSLYPGDGGGRPECATDADCPVGSRCDRTGAEPTCVPAPANPIPDAGVGGGEDAGAAPVSPPDAGPPPTVPPSSGQACRIGADCPSGACVGDGATGVCAARCSEDRSCPGDLVCRVGVCLGQIAPEDPERSLVGNNCQTTGGGALELWLLLGVAWLGLRGRRPSWRET